ncbi:hypothetical protein HanXRQr2_Chr10g0451201 [Helianthus annuus]|uniref:Uncharacterized protein n=1 Tax=Helianthus annuus TaxID=4232 RepID=A0A9K3HZL7_HELAN|nr:uncharacterized protein LOC110886012 isoform X2 [Helianthus annuus]KAF5787300.1 hypothetical protein HanXRQr2_Chr10g0451201 [Helianthus annuus]
MEKCDNRRYLFSLTSLQIGDLQSYLSDLSLFLATDCKNFYVLVDNRPWLQDLVSRPAHLWQLMVTKSRMSPFAITRARKDVTNTHESKNLQRWFAVIDAAILSKKKALLPVEKLRNSLFANSKSHRILYGFIVFEVAWKDVRGINYLNELQTDTSLAIEAKYMRRWEFDSISQAAKGITSWFPGTPRERFLLNDKLNSMLGLRSEGDVFHDAPDCNDSNDKDEDDDDDVIDGQTEILHDQMSTIDEAIQYRDVLLLFRFNDHDLPFELQEIITSDLRLLTLLEAGLPSWVIFFQSYPVFCHIYRPWMCPLARVLYVAVSVVTVVIGFYDLYKNIPLLKAAAARLCGPLFGWIETWEMLSRIKYLGTMLFLHNSEKAFKWFLRMSRSVRSCITVITQPLSEPFMVFLEVLLPIFQGYIQMGEYLCSFIWILITTCWNLVDSLIKIILFPVYFIASTIWTIVTLILYPIFWLICGILYAPIGLIIGLSNFVGFMFNQIYDFIGDISLFLSGLFKLASAAESSVGSHEVSMWRTLWNDLFSQIFRAIRSILSGFVAFFTACNRHRLSIYNHVQEFVRRLYQPTERSCVSDFIQRAKKPAESRERRKPLLIKSIKQS